MKSLLIALVAVLLFSSCHPNIPGTVMNSDSTAADSSTSATVNKTDAGWISLFDGKTLNGWHTFGMTNVSPKWSVDSGAVYFNPKTKGAEGDLVTNDSFSNFDLKLNWKIIKGGNSGILIYVQDDKPKYEETFETGPEMQVLDDERNDDRNTPTHRAGSLYDMIQATPGAVKPAEQWNAVEIKSDNGRLAFFLNNVNVVNTTMWDDGWKKMIAGSKFKQWPAFGTFKNGHIALQDHGFDVWYKDIMIKKL